MNRCPKCDTDFEGKFCPQCGEKWQDEKLCPRCGTKLDGSAKFCNECGYSFAKQETEEGDRTLKLYNYLKFVPMATFVLFAILLFIFYATPVVSLILGDGFPNESLGNVYKMSGLLEEIPKIKSVMVILIVLLIISVIIAGINIYFEIKKTQNTKIKSIFENIPYGIYLIYFIIGIVIVAQIKKADEGMDVLATGACPILLIVFSLILAFISIGSKAMRKMLYTKNPTISEYENKCKEIDIKRKEEYYATHKEPELILSGDKKVDKRAKSIYKFNKKNYEKAKESKTPKGIIWLDIHKISLSITAVLIIAIILILIIIIPVLTSKFRIGVVEKIEIGDPGYQVEKILGLPDETATESGYIVWSYYGKNYLNIKQKLEKNSQEQEKAFTEGDEKQLEKLIDEEEKLKGKLETMIYSYIEIKLISADSNNLKVVSVLLDKNKSNDSTYKIIKKAELSDYNFSCSDILSGNIKTNVKISYKDGSYRKYIVPVGAFENMQELDIAEWSDEWGEYKFDVNIQHKAESEYITDETRHWKKCSVCGKKINVCNHNYGGGETCVECGKIKNHSAGLLFELYSNQQSYYVSGIGTCPYPDIVIPEIYNGSPVTGIGKQAFYNCDNLQSIKIPSSVTNIGESAFENCTNLQNIEIPSSVTEIGYRAFADCYLQEVHIADIASWCNIDFMYDGSSNPLYHGAKLYIGDRKVIDLEIPKEITEIKDYTFEGCSSIQTVTFEKRSNLQSIGNNVFFDYDNLKNIEIPPSVTSIGRYAFFGCTIQSIEIPSSITNIGNQAFSGCSNLKEVHIEDIASWCNIDFIDYASNPSWHGAKLYIGDREVINLEIPKEVIKIKAYVFWDCNNIQTVTFEKGSNLQSIGNEAFYDCKNLQSIEIPSSVTKIENSAFFGCSKLRAVYYGGTKYNWSDIDGDDKFPIYATIYYYSASNPENEPDYDFKSHYWYREGDIIKIW